MVALLVLVRLVMVVQVVEMEDHRDLLIQVVDQEILHQLVPRKEIMVEELWLQVQVIQVPLVVVVL
tara:strand:+ start:162 stop:359 length:198 start_codon:yes stop_codon:yes gene_type:complete